MLNFAPMFVDIAWLLLGLALTLWGANALTDGASALARRLGVTDLVIGLTVVAFGTSAPELTISVVAAADGATSLAVGNVVGSCIANILLIIGLTAIIRPVTVDDTVMTRQLPLMVLTAFLLWILGFAGVISRFTGIAMLVIFGAFMAYTVRQSRHTGTDANAETKGKPMPVAKAVIWVVLGLGCLIFGGDRLVAGASGLALRLGMSQAMVGLTIVAVGTSLPELATSVSAALKGLPGMAVGNVIGSNIFNVLVVLGAAAVVRPLQFGGVGMVDLSVMVGASLLFWLAGRVIGHHIVTRAEGAVMLAGYAGYLAWLIW